MVDEPWDKQAALDAVEKKYSRLADRVIAAMWVYQRDLEVLSGEYAHAKADYERRVAGKVIRIRAGGEKSAEVAKMRANDDDEVFELKVRWLTVEQLIRADREALKILHGRLDDLRTQAADHRAAGAWEARS